MLTSCDHRPPQVTENLDKIRKKPKPTYRSWFGLEVIVCFLILFGRSLTEYNRVNSRDLVIQEQVEIIVVINFIMPSDNGGVKLRCRI